MIWYYEIFSRYFNTLCNAVSHFLATNNHLNFFLLKKDKFGQEGLFSILLSVMWWLISLVFGWLVFFSSCFGTYMGENMNTWIWSTFQMIVWDFHNSAIFNYAGLVVYTPLSYIKQSLSFWLLENVILISHFETVDDTVGRGVLATHSLPHSSIHTLLLAKTIKCIESYKIRRVIK